MSCKWQHYGNKLSRYLIKLSQIRVKMHSGQLHTIKNKIVWGYDIRVKNGFLGMFRNVKVDQFKDLLQSRGGFVAIIVENSLF